VDPKIFITYSSKDQKVARTICTALENRGLICWISARNVKPGQNYQEQIVRAIRTARVMVLVFTANANNSNEIKKELALASQNNLVVIPVRIEDVAPNEAFAYEFATRQWIDLFEDWEKSISELVELIAAILDEPPAGDRAKAAPGLPGEAAAPAFVMAAAWPATKPAVPFIQRPATRWAMIAGLAVVVASVVAFAAVKLSLRPSSTSVTTSVVSPPPAQPPAAPASPVPSAPARAVPSAPPPSVPSAPPPAPPATTATAGALAVALPADVAKSGFSYGYSNNNADAAHAQAAALNACRTTKDASNDANLRSLCKVVLNYSNQCIAVAMDPAAGTPGVGWAVANDLRSAERQALGQCQETAGPGRRAACVIDHSACDGNAR
jgi:TIR domain-containing protein/uncharacterized protein DUF4189